MPVALLHAYSVMLPRLEAEEILNNVLSSSIGFNGGDEGKDAIRRLQRQAKGIIPPPRKRMTGQEFATSMGMRIQVHKPKESIDG